MRHINRAESERKLDWKQSILSTLVLESTAYLAPDVGKAGGPSVNPVQTCYGQDGPQITRGKEGNIPSK